MKILIPMAGEGSRFASQGYKPPKPLINIKNKPMIQCVVENLSFDNAEYIFLVRKKHLNQYEDLNKKLSEITNEKYKIVEVDSLTEGAACTALLAKQYINNDEDLLIANSDQIIEYEEKNFCILKSLCDVDAIVFTFKDTNPKWSFVKVNSKGFITEVAEKKPISDIATCGIYWYRKGSDFVKYAEKMISKNVRVNNEFYIAPVYNELLLDNKSLIPFYVSKMHGVGTPEDLKKYLGE